jgi:arsenic resistance protein ArsH
MSRLRQLTEADALPALDPAFLFRRPADGLGSDQPPPRILLLYGSLRER